MWKPWARAGARPLDANLVAVLPFRTAGADPSVQYLRQGMVDLMQAKLTGEGGPRAADARSVLAAVRDAGGGDAEDLSESRRPPSGAEGRRGAGAPGQHRGLGGASGDECVARQLGGRQTLTQTSVAGPRDSLFVLIDRLTAQLLALGAGASADQLSALTTTNLDALRAYLDGVAAYRRGAFQTRTPTALPRGGAGLDLRARAVGAGRGRRLAPRDHRHDADPPPRVAVSGAPQPPRPALPLAPARLALSPQHAMEVRIADAEHAVQRSPRAPRPGTISGDVLFHFGRVWRHPDPEVRARQAFEQAFQRDSLFGAPIQHLAMLTWVAGDTAAQRVWSGRLIALDSTAEGVPGARWNLLQAPRDTTGLRAFCGRARGAIHDGAPGHRVLRTARQSHHASFQDRLFDAAYRLAATKADRIQVAADRVRALENRGRPAQSAKWVDTVATMSVRQAGFLGITADVLVRRRAGGHDESWTRSSGTSGRLWRAMPLAGRACCSSGGSGPPQDSTDGFYARAVPCRGRLAAMRGDPAAARLTDLADSLLQGREDVAAWAWLELARLYEGQGRVDRALRAVRRRYLPLGEPEAGGLAESFRMEGRLAALADDKVGALRAYQNYLRLRFDPEPSRVPQLDSVRAEIGRSAASRRGTSRSGTFEHVFA